MLIVPTLRVGMPLGTLRVPVVTRSIVENGCDGERHGLHSHAERGNDQVVAAGLFASLLAKASDQTPQESASATFACN
ncbi:hypothetical protein EGJ55_11825 [Pseudomonas moraviensis]|nr:hypothetical protein EGJ55_11825 [Pseudomonas moraviensis]